ncbi:MAG: hypothetical protein SNH80_02715 [Rikenellaceae bacterium]
MKKLLIFLQCMVMVLCLTSCEKDPSPTADINLEDTYRVYNRNRSGNLDLTYSGSNVYTMYEMYVYKSGGYVTVFSDSDYMGCYTYPITNYSDTSGSDVGLSGDLDEVPDEFIEITFDRVISEAVEASVTTIAADEVKYRYVVKYYTDRTAFITGLNGSYQEGLDDAEDYYTWSYRASTMNVYNITYSVTEADEEQGIESSTEEVVTLIQALTTIGIQETQFARE